jgi:hypothetical protein
MPYPGLLAHILPARVRAIDAGDRAWAPLQPTGQVSSIVFILRQAFYA